MMIVLLLFLQKQNLANAIYLFGLGTLLNITHVEKTGMTVELIVHWKDTTVVWKRQYIRLEFPVLLMFNIDSINLIDPMVQYPPVVASKPFCGACKKRGHTKTSK